ncbi:hypothetical protein SLEP1_g44064 [Rubroshorea leprosula]|uniref:Uncharacterized protein n=1 Tax=Rubroshorea leprosula TaxID=152421 RepID=A0AAV5LF15_9ROSI|nr:hypothetical protein SLEP1_g44064 [Rubroshorea leprosula]
MKASLVVDDGFIYEEEKLLTVLKTSLFFANDGFTVYDCNGQLVFRVDSYGPDTRDRGEVVLMDAQGRCLLTVRRKVWYSSLFSPSSLLAGALMSSSESTQFSRNWILLEWVDSLSDFDSWV